MKLAVTEPKRAASRTSGQMAAYLKSEIDKNGKIVRAIGLKID